MTKVHRTLRILIATAPLALAMGSCGPDDSAGTAVAESAWLTDFEEARARALETGRPILADFTGSDWCGWCIRLKKEVFDTPAFAQWAGERVVLLELDFPRKTELPEELAEQNQRLAAQFGIEGFPTIVFMDHEGRELARSGYVRGGADAWIEDAEEKLE
jgi:thioredoxin-related protein